MDLGWPGENERNVLPNLARRMMPQVYLPPRCWFTYLLVPGPYPSIRPPPPPMSWNYEVFQCFPHLTPMTPISIKTEMDHPERPGPDPS